MRILVVGISGSGKTTLARRLSAGLAIPHVELDALHWEADWQALTRTDPAAFIRRVDAATTGPEWVADGNYRLVRALLWQRATHLVWLDYNRAVVMRRVIWRSLLRISLRTRIWSDNVERWQHLLQASHPIRWAWRNWRALREEYDQMLQQADRPAFIVHRLRHPREAAAVLQCLLARAES